MAASSLRHIEPLLPASIQDATATPGVISGVGTIQTDIPVSQPTPNLISGAGTQQSVVIIAVARPSAIAGTGGIQNVTPIVVVIPIGQTAGSGTFGGGTFGGSEHVLGIGTILTPTINTNTRSGLVKNYLGTTKPIKPRISGSFVTKPMKQKSGGVWVTLPG